MRPKWGRRPYLTEDCARCARWLDVPAGGRCRAEGGPAVEVGEDGRTCLTFRETEWPDWHALVGGNRGVDGL